MAEPFVGEIRMMSFDFAPKYWATCDGQLLPINQNQALFSLLGTAFGGNGQTNFALPDLRGRTPIHVGAGHGLGERGGAAVHTVSLSEMPQHTHVLNAASANADAATPAGNHLGSAANLYGPPGAQTSLDPTTVTTVGGSQPHQNLQPYLSLNFCIALLGIFPSPN